MYTIGRILLALLVLPSAASATQQSPKNHASWWVQTYGLVDTSGSPSAARAERVFQRVAATADKKVKRLPRLVIIKATGDPFAIALPDGTVVLTEGGLKLCYDGVEVGKGDARVAFVFGHELAHLANDDFWHAAAFNALRSHETNERSRINLTELLTRGPKEAQSAELHADAHGLLYLTMAGYDPNVLLGQEISFFEEWVSQVSGESAYTDQTHRPPAERADFLLTQLASVAEELDFFHFGVRLYQLGRYEDALLLLERFKDRFPGREVFNNIGLSHYQLAVRFLGICDGRLVVRFKLPTVLDPSTRAARLRSGEGSSPCFRAERFRRHFREAERNLTEAAEMDPGYAPARLNLLSLYALAQQGAQAIVAAEEAKELLPDDARVQSGVAVARYLYGQQSGLEMADAAIEQLQRLSQSHPDSSEAAYNVASMLAERRRVQAAEEAYRVFLELEPTGVFADTARNYIGASVAQETEVPPTSRNFPEPPVPLGPMKEEELRERFPDLEVQSFVIGGFNGSFIRFEGGRALAIGDTVELVEEELVEEEIGSSSRGGIPVQEGYGEPSHEHATTIGSIVFYNGFALELIGGRPERRFYY